MRVLSRNRATEEVLANGKLEAMTSTQAYRFNELQQLGYADAQPPDLADKSVYELDEAAERLAVSVDELLALAAEGKARCVVNAKGLSGRWDESATVPAKTDSRPAFLVLPPASCAEIRDFGSANVTELHHDSAQGLAVFRLRATQFIDTNRVLMLHPLPGRH